jgi:hypothetical protein
MLRRGNFTFLRALRHRVFTWAGMSPFAVDRPGAAKSRYIPLQLHFRLADTAKSALGFPIFVSSAFPVEPAKDADLLR